jgi:DNA modification methylase
LSLYYDHDGIQIYHGDCLEIMPGLGRFDLLLTDPPYGIERFKRGSLRFDKKGEFPQGIAWDVAPEEGFLSDLLNTATLAIVWGFNNLPLPRTEHFLVWDKEQTVDNFASAELAWSNLPTPAKVFRYSIHRHNSSKAGGHPTEKPIKLMTWCISLAGEVQTIFDPYAGIGTTGLAAKELGCQAVLVEREERYCEIAAKRLSQGVLDFGG